MIWSVGNQFSRWNHSTHILNSTFVLNESQMKVWPMAARNGKNTILNMILCTSWYRSFTQNFNTNSIVIVWMKTKWIIFRTLFIRNSIKWSFVFMIIEFYFCFPKTNMDGFEVWCIKDEFEGEQRKVFKQFYWRKHESRSFWTVWSDTINNYHQSTFLLFWCQILSIFK